MKIPFLRKLFLLVVIVTSMWLLVSLLNNNFNANKSSNIIELEERDRWIVLAGDSNLKTVWNRIVQTFPIRYSKQIKSKIVSTGFYENVYRWTDRDVIFYFKNNTKLRISLKFLHGGKNEFSRINNKWSDIRLCNVSCDHSTSPSFQDKEFDYTSKPDLLWITHGLWALNTDLTDEEADCYGSTPFSEYINTAAQYIKSIKNEITIIWQTNPSIAWHPKIKKSHVKLDYLCQKKLAAEYKLPLFDIYKYTDKINQKAMGSDYHYDDLTQQYIIDRIFNRTFIASLKVGAH